jgi:hypothetical protein
MRDRTQHPRPQPISKTANIHTYIDQAHPCLTGAPLLLSTAARRGMSRSAQKCLHPAAEGATKVCRSRTACRRPRSLTQTACKNTTAAVARHKIVVNFLHVWVLLHFRKVCKHVLPGLLPGTGSGSKIPVAGHPHDKAVSQQQQSTM